MSVLELDKVAIVSEGTTVATRVERDGILFK